MPQLIRQLEKELANRNAVIEECAKICDAQAERARTSAGSARASSCADAIRALKNRGEHLEFSKY